MHFTMFAETFSFFSSINKSQDFALCSTGCLLHILISTKSSLNRTSLHLLYKTQTVIKKVSKRNSLTCPANQINRIERDTMHIHQKFPNPQKFPPNLHQCNFLHLHSLLMFKIQLKRGLRFWNSKNLSLLMRSIFSVQTSASKTNSNIGRSRSSSSSSSDSNSTIDDNWFMSGFLNLKELNTLLLKYIGQVQDLELNQSKGNANSSITVNIDR